MFASLAWNAAQASPYAMGARIASVSLIGIVQGLAESGGIYRVGELAAQAGVRLGGTVLRVRGA